MKIHLHLHRQLSPGMGTGIGNGCGATVLPSPPLLQQVRTRCWYYQKGRSAAGSEGASTELWRPTMHRPGGAETKNLNRLMPPPPVMHPPGPPEQAPPGQTTETRTHIIKFGRWPAGMAEVGTGSRRTSAPSPLISPARVAGKCRHVLPAVTPPRSG